MDKQNYLYELYCAKKELLRCYQFILDIQQKINCFPEEEVCKSIGDIKDDIEAMEVDIDEYKPKEDLLHQS
jgi:hypothetical protein